MFYYFNYNKLDEIATEKQELYRNMQPFPYTVIQEAANTAALNDVLKVFPSVEELNWWKYNNSFEKKLAFDDVSLMPDEVKSILCEFNSSNFVKFLEKLTGIEHLIPDPHYTGGGLHQIVNGGLLNLHADFNFNAKLKLHRRINVLLYLNHDWKDTYGGELELWDKDVRTCHTKIFPHFNTMVIFNTTDGAIHGHPNPLNVPLGVTRKSLALYYYTAERPESEISDPHSTIYKFKPDDQPSEELKELQKKRSKGRI